MPAGLPAWNPHDTFALETMSSIALSSLMIRSGTFSPRSELRSMDVMGQPPMPMNAKMGPIETIPMYHVSNVTRVPAMSNHFGYVPSPSSEDRNHPMNMNTVRPIGRIRPLRPPTNTRIAAGAVPASR